MNTGIEAFDTSLQTTQIWLNEVMEELGWDNRHRAYLALRAVLHTLRDRLSASEAAHLGAQLPMLVRGFYYDGWTPTGKPTKERHKKDFLDKMAAYFPKEPELDVEKIAQAVFRVLERHISKGEILDIKHSLPKEFLGLWSSEAET